MTKQLITCNICKKSFNGFGGLGTHLSKKIHDISLIEYYNLYLKKENEGKCIVCGNMTKLKNISEGYRPTCGLGCSRKMMHLPESRLKSKTTCLRKYGSENPASLSWVKKKISNAQKNRFANPKEREKTSITTKQAMWKLDVREKYLRARSVPLSEETHHKMSLAAKNRLNDPIIRKKIYTSVRNQKISNSKIEYWKNRPDEKKRFGNNWKIWKERDEIGWRRHLQMASKKGFAKIFRNYGETILETKMYKFLEDKQIKFEKQYELDWKFYDAYLPDYNLLLEFDGLFWHKETLEECQYPFQIQAYYNDRKKDEIAKTNNIPLFRIRENEHPKKILELIGKKL